ncbi:hypothetical protein M3Y97_01074700 [Aphelenchoides bicaudatus]|nr:hypothetical protein M3Y97_01074700 [Aphelenchoides bicaudatus]
MNNDNLTRKCFCDVDVHLATKISLWFQIIATCGVTILAAMHWSNVAILMSVHIILCLVVIYGMESKQPLLYFPYLFYVTLFVCFQIGFIIYGIVRERINPIRVSDHFILFVLLVCAVIFTTYFAFLIPYYSYKLIDVSVNTIQPIATFHTNQSTVHSTSILRPQYYASSPQQTIFVQQYPVPLEVGRLPTYYNSYYSPSFFDPFHGPGMCCPGFMGPTTWSTEYRFWRYF